MEEKRQTLKIGTSTKAVLIVVMAAAIAVSVALYYSNNSNSLGQNVQPQPESMDDSVPPDALRRGPPPVPLVESHGPSFSVTQAKVLSGFESASLPSDTPDLRLASVRIRTSQDPQSNLMTAFYTLDGTKAGDTDTFGSVMANGGIAVIYAHEPTTPTYDQEKWIQEFVRDAPDVRRIESVNGNPAIAVTGNPDKDLTSQVFLYKENMQINLVSLKSTEADLLKIASSIP